MATERLTIVVDERGARVVAGNIASIGRAGRAAGQDINFLKTTLLGLSVGAAVREVAQLSDSYTVLANRLRIVTSSAGNLATVQSEIFDLARRSRSDVLGTAELYSRVARSSDKLGLSQKELLEVTETVNQAIKASGATAQEAGAGVIQFAQGLASGALRGDELRSVLEQMPRLARAIADGMGIDIGRLRELGEQGKLTAKEVIAAIQDQAPAIAEEFAKVTPTISEAFTIWRNEAIKFIGELNDATGASEAVSRVILTLADNMDILAVAVSAVTAALLVLISQQILRGVIALSAALAANPVLAVVAAIAAATSALIFYGNQIKVTEDGSVGLWDYTKAALSVIGEKVGEVAASMREKLGSAIDFVKERFKAFDIDVSGIWDGMLDAVKRVINIQIGLWVGLFNSILELGRGFLLEMERMFMERTLDFSLNVTEIIGSAFKAALSRDFVQEFMDLLDEFNSTVIGRAREIAEVNATPLGGEGLNGPGGGNVRSQLQGWDDFVKGIHAGLQDVMNDVNDFSKNAQDAVVASFGAMEDALVDFITTGKFNFADFVSFIAAELARLAVQMAIIRPLLGAFGITPAARGGIMDHGDLQTFASGGIVNRPTLFPTNSGMGLMGEAGTEGILPLALTSSGLLGVHAVGSGNQVFAPNIQVTIPGGMGGQNGPDAAFGKRIGVQITREIEAKFMEWTANQQRPGGIHNRGRAI